MLIDIFDYQDVLVLRLPADMQPYSVVETVQNECRDAVDVFRPEGAVIDMTGTNASKFLGVTVYHLVVIGKKWGFTLAVAGRRSETEKELRRLQIIQYTGGCYDTVKEAVDALPPSSLPGAAHDGLPF